MDLREFTSKALLDIIAGVSDAQQKTDSGAVVPSGIKEVFDAVKAGISPLQPTNSKSR